MTTTTEIPAIGDEEWEARAMAHNAEVVKSIENLLDHAGRVRVITLVGTTQDFVITCIDKGDKRHAN